MKKTKVISALLVIAMCFMFMGAASSSQKCDDIVTLRYESIFKIEVNISRSGYFVIADSTVLDDSRYNVDSVTTIQESSSGEYWTSVESSTTSSCKYLGKSGKFYRAIITATVYDDNGVVIEKVTRYSYDMQF